MKRQPIDFYRFRKSANKCLDFIEQLLKSDAGDPDVPAKFKKQRSAMRRKVRYAKNKLYGILNSPAAYATTINYIRHCRTLFAYMKDDGFIKQERYEGCYCDLGDLIRNDEKDLFKDFSNYYNWLEDYYALYMFVLGVDYANRLNKEGYYGVTKQLQFVTSSYKM